jgi:small subunit ribosomal protein S20
MANIKSARKRAKQALERRDHNMGLRTSVRTAIKKVTKAVAAGNKDAALASLQESQRVIDRVVAKGILHRNAGDRHKSRLAHAIKTPLSVIVNEASAHGADPFASKVMGPLAPW